MFNKFRKVDPILGPEMKSTGEVMGRGKTFGEAFGKSMMGAGQLIPSEGNVFISVKDEDKPQLKTLCTKLKDLGFKLFIRHMKNGIQLTEKGNALLKVVNGNRCVQKELAVLGTLVTHLKLELDPTSELPIVAKLLNENEKIKRK